jgi:alkylresorcinol/alkylpyrone synthase
MAVIRATSTRLPSFTYSKADICAVGDRWLKDAPHELELFKRFVSSSQITQRHFAVPLETILSLGGPASRAQHFQEHARPLLSATISQLLTDVAIDPQTVDHLVFTSCSAPTIPAIDVGIVDDLRLRRSLSRIPVYQHGCAGGVVGLAMAHRVLRSGQTAIVSSAELCSLVYQSADLTGGNLVGSAIFGDGAAAALLQEVGPGLAIIDARSHLVPESAHLMGYNSEDNGPHLRLDRALPQALAQHAPPFITSFLSDNGLAPTEISWWLFHPGGVKVLAALEETLKIERCRSRWAWDILERFGNMSSASILFVLDAFMRSSTAKPNESVCMVGVGPGLTIEAILLRQKVN